MTAGAPGGAPDPPGAQRAGGCRACRYGLADPWPCRAELDLLAPALARQERAACHAYARRPTAHHRRAWHAARAARQAHQAEYAALYAARCAAAPEDVAAQPQFPLQGPVCKPACAHYHDRANHAR
jgi:hypothetical protein